MLAAFRQGQVNVMEIALKELHEEIVNMMVADMLHVDSDVSIPMTQLLYHHTKGNALFAVEFLWLMH
jgi:predicted ATPase